MLLFVYTTALLPGALPLAAVRAYSVQTTKLQIQSATSNLDTALNENVTNKWLIVYFYHLKFIIVPLPGGPTVHPTVWVRSLGSEIETNVKSEETQKNSAPREH